MITIRDIDEYLLDRAQLVSDGVHAYTGLDCLQQARALGVLVALGWLLEIAYQETTRHSFDWLAALCLLGRVTTIFFETSSETAARTNARTGTRNPRRLDPIAFLYRMLSASLVPFAPFSRSQLGMLFVSIWASAVLEACDVQTPRPGKIREALRDIGFRMLGMKPVPSQ